MHIKRNRTSKILTTLLSLLLIVSVVFPMELAHVISKNLFARAAMTVGGSGSLVPGSPQTAVSGIAPGVTFRNPPLRVSLFRDKKALLTEEEGLSKIYNAMNKGFPQNITASVHFIRPETATFIGSKPISIGEANTANKTLTYLADSNAISNIITMEGGTPNTTNGVYYSAIKATGLDNFKTNWRSKMTSTYASKEAWSWILAKSGDDYLVDTRIKTLFGGENGNLDYNNIKAWTDAQSNDAYMRYLDMLMTLYTLSSGDTKEQWGQAVDDYINSDNLQESPISISIDSEALMSFNGGAYFILIPTIDYLEFATGLEKAFATSEDIWWATSALTDAHPGHSYAQLELSAKKSVAISPTFARISDYYTNQNGFSFAATAFTKGVLRTQSPTSIFWTAPDSILTDYLNIFRLEDPANPGGGMYGYMLSPAPLKVPSLSVGVLKAEPDNKVIETKAIGMPVSLTVTSGTKAEDYGSWEAMILNARTQGNLFNIKMAFSRTSVEVPQIPFISPNPAEFNWTPDEMLDFIYGRKNYIGTDDTSGISTEGKSQITFNYILATTITSGGKTWTGTSTDTASFRILAPRIGYTSKPDAYSELKNYGTGSNLTGNLTESWEAMAGVPSTEQLYFAAGGSEFIVDITVERIEDEVAKRSYDSYYTTTNCEFFTGDTSKGLMGAPDHGGLASGSTVNQTGPSGGGGCGSPPGWTPPNPGTRTYTYTSASDVRARSVTVSPVFHDTSSTSVSHSEGHGSGSAQNPHSCGHGACSYSYAYSGYWTYTIPMHAVCGPCCSHVLPEVHDTWAQTWTYDAMKIVDVHVWKIDQAAVDGLTSIISTDIVGADIVKGEPNIFYNIALKNDANFMAQDGKGSASGTSRAGRVRYSVDAPQHDEVIYANGTRTNNCDGLANTYGGNTSAGGGSGHTHAWADGFIYNAFKPGASTGGATAQEGQLNYPTDTDNFLVTNTDAKDKATTEYAKFLSQRQTKITPTMITDFLILQTSNGDQAVMYFHKPAPSAVNTETKMPQLNITTAEMWDNNLNSASKWKDDHINIGGYNGKYTTPASKFTWPNQGNAASTFLDPDPAGTIVRPTRPSSSMMLYQGALNIILQNKNKSYISGKAEVFWANSLHWVDKSSERFLGITDALTTASFPTTMQVGQTGFNFHTIANYTPSGPAIGGYILAAPYSDEHVKINDLIVQDPVSTQDVSLVSLPADRDQRTGEILGGAGAAMEGLNNSLVCPREPALCDFRVLNCTFFEDTVLADFDFSTVDLSGNPINKTTGNSLILPAGFTLQAHGSLTGTALRAQGTRVALPFSELQLQYSSSTKLRVEGDIVMNAPTGGGSMIFSFGSYDFWVPAGQTLATLNTGNGWERQITKPVADGVKHHIVVDFSLKSVDSCKVTVDGVEGYSRFNASNDVNSQTVGTNLYIGSWGYDNNYPANFYLDNLKVTRLAGTTEHNDDCYKLMTVHPNGLNAHQHTVECLNGTKGADITGNQSFSYTGNYQEFTAPGTGTYTLEVWGAQGGTTSYTSATQYQWYNSVHNQYLWYPSSTGFTWDYCSNHSSSYTGVTQGGNQTATGGYGGYSKGGITLNKGDKLYIYSGGQGAGDTSGGYANGGFNGGGQGYYYSGGGGGATDIRKTGTALGNRVIVAGGGGGAQLVPSSASTVNGGAGGGASGSNGGTHGYWTTSYTTGGGTQSAGGVGTGWATNGSSGQGGNQNGNTYIGGGGGGYFGGAAGTYHGYSGAGGSGYTTGLASASSTVGSNPGNGKAKISWSIEGAYTSGAEWFVNAVTNGELTEQQIKDILGDAYEPIMANSYGPVIHTWSNWTSGSMYGFTPLNQVSLSTSGGNLVQTSSGVDPHFDVPVNFAASGVTKIEVTFDNKTASDYSQLFWARSDAAGYSGTRETTFSMAPNTDNQTKSFIVRNHAEWKGTITSLRFDMGTTAGITNIKDIKIYGAGTLGSTGSGGTGTVVWENGTPGQYTYNAPVGNYKLEVWGAQGGYYQTSGGLGGYSVGSVNIGSASPMSIFVGGQGGISNNTGGFNGGANGSYNSGGGGGTDIRINGTGLGNRAIVAGGGGGGSHTGNGGYGGGTIGGTDSSGNQAGGNQSAGGNGTGGNGVSWGGGNSSSHGGPGGGGYFGGAGGSSCAFAGGGGSGYVGGVTSANGVTAQTIAGNATIPGTSGGTTVGRAGNGYAKITSMFSPVTITNGSTGSTISTTTFSPTLFNGLSYTNNGSSTRTVGTIQQAHVGSTIVIATANGNSENNTTSVPYPPSDITQVGAATQGRAWYKKKIDQSDVGRSITITGAMSSWGYIAYFIPDGWDLTQVVSSTSATILATTNTDTAIMSNLAGLNSANGYSAWNTSYGNIEMYMSTFTGGNTSFLVPITTAWHNTNSPHAIFTRTSTTNGGGSTTEGQVLNYGYTGSAQTAALSAGTYRLETWGAQGGDGTAVANTGGKGGYSKGEITLATDQSLYVYVGGMGGAGASVGWNGGGTGGDAGHTGAGGGASDIRTVSGAWNANLATRLIVGGGGGGIENCWGGDHLTNIYGSTGAGGGSAGKNGKTSQPNGYGTGGTQSAAGYNVYDGNAYGGLGFGGAGGSISTCASGGGGGYYGGGAAYGGNGGGGSGYVGSLANASTIAGDATSPSVSGGTQVGQTGHGYVKITALTVNPPTPIIILTKADVANYWTIIPNNLPDGTQNPIWGCNFVPNIHVCDSDCVEVDTLVCAEPHHKGMHYDPSNTICWDACMDDETHKNYKPTINASDGSFTPGNFLNIDYGFRIYFPNVGDFADGQPYGIGGLTSQRGLGFKNTMDTTKWTREKRIRFEFNVIYKGNLYLAGEWVLLGDRGSYGGAPGSKYTESQWSGYGSALYNDVDKQYYDFYAVLANYEAKSASIDVEVEAVNCLGPNDNRNSITNRSRGRFTSLHGGSNTTYADVVGRIGNLIIEDTGDYRFSNFFKKPLENNKGSKIFNYTGGVQTFTAPTDGNYKLESWGASGGNSTKFTTKYGGKGGYTTGTVYLTAGQTIYIYAGGAGGPASGTDTTTDAGGWNGGGSLVSGQSLYGAPGGGATDFRLLGGAWNDITSLQSRLIVAGGGGGANTRDGDVALAPYYYTGYGNGAGGYGGGPTGGNGTTGNQDSVGFAYGYYYGSGGTQSSGGSTHRFVNGVLQSSTVNGALGAGGGNNQAGGGGGYYGGAGAAHGGAGGGSGYVNPTYVTAGSNISGNQSFTAIDGGNETGHSGDGAAKITWNIGSVPVTSIYGTANGLAATGSASVVGTKVDINALGSSATVPNKAVTTGFYRVDVEGKALNNGRLTVKTTDGADWSGKDFIANVTVTTTKMSFSLKAPSDKAINVSWVANSSTPMEVQGISLTRLGETADTWIIDGVVRQVDESDQNFYMTWSKDIRGLPIGNNTNQVNTYSTLNWVDGNRIQAPLSAEKNNINILKDEPLLVGYPIYFDISTLGNYFWNNSSSVQVVPYYYALNTTTKQLVPVDAYFQYEAKYEPVNIHNLVNPDWEGEGIYNYVITLDWLGEHVRRNYTDVEKRATDFFRDFYAEGTTSMGAGSGESGEAGMVQNKPAKQLDAPVGSSYILGNAQFLRATGKARTFIGGETTYGELMNRGGSNTITTDTMGSKYNAQGRLYDYLWWQSAQRWHLKLGLPSSSVFVRTGEVPDTENIKEFDNSNHVILLAADIRVIGDTYVLRYEHNTDNGSINIQRTDGTTSGPITLPNNIPPVLAVYSTVKSSMYDIDIISTH